MTAPDKRNPEILPAVCRAGEFQFAPDQTHTNHCVQSRGLFWCKSGRGTFVVNGRQFTLEPHDLYVLPWNRHISYHAGSQDPMFTAHVHLVPWLRPGSKWVPNVPHEKDEPLFNSPDRADVRFAPIDGPVRLHVDFESSLGRLINYTTLWYRESNRSEEEGRALGILLVREVQRLFGRVGHTDMRRPGELNRLLVYIEKNFHTAPTVEQLASIINRSRSHVLKLFRVHMKMSAKAFIINRQMKEARELLVNTTLPVSEVGRRSGIQDPYHFSKLFRRVVGQTPTEFRTAQTPMPITRKPSVHRPEPPSPKSED